MELGFLAEFKSESSRIQKKGTNQCTMMFGAWFLFGENYTFALEIPVLQEGDFTGGNGNITMMMMIMITMTTMTTTTTGLLCSVMT
jgi:hypothetical protein